MLILLHNYHVRPQRALKLAGYTKRPEKNDWVREDGGRGRFHAKLLDKQVIDIHYDLFVDSKHWSPYTPITHGRERGRVYAILKHFKFREMKEQERNKYMDKYAFVVI